MENIHCRFPLSCIHTAETPFPFPFLIFFPLFSSLFPSVFSYIIFSFAESKCTFDLFFVALFSYLYGGLFRMGWYMKNFTDF